MQNKALLIVILVIVGLVFVFLVVRYIVVPIYLKKQSDEMMEEEFKRKTPPKPVKPARIEIYSPGITTV